MTGGARDRTVAGRLLPWTGADGKPCYLVSDGTGCVARLADEIEDVQIDMADALLGHAVELLAERRVSGEELHYLARRLSESLRDVKRVAESRGARLVEGSRPWPGWRQDDALRRAYARAARARSPQRVEHQWRRPWRSR
ncbi:hypothetical protein ACF09Y_07895 [Streptomyces massasporeus]|uniref:hypothetical protein n=1 Tax=Streptomyces massasporeus TaxID=67324 RepID=UPI0036FCD233